MKRTRWLLIALLLLASAGCARRDWVSDMLTLADVTGSWTGSVTCEIKMATFTTRTVSFDATFRQSGSRVTGRLSWSLPVMGMRDVELEGAVNGDLISFTGRAVSAVSAEATVDGDEMTGLLQGLCTAMDSSRSRFYLRRESSGRPRSPAQ